MKRRPLIMLVTLAVLGGLATVGCGDDDSSTGDSTTSGVTAFSGDAPTDSISYHLAADKYCRQAENELDEAAREQFGDQQPSPEDLEAFVNDYYLPVMRRQIEQIRTIPIPPGEEDAVNEIYDAFDDGLAEAEADPGSLADGPPPGIVEASRLAVEYGFDDCGLDT
jgi:hypothetical protein